MILRVRGVYLPTNGTISMFTPVNLNTKILFFPVFMGPQWSQQIPQKKQFSTLIAKTNRPARKLTGLKNPRIILLLVEATEVTPRSPRYVGGEKRTGTVLRVEARTLFPSAKITLALRVSLAPRPFEKTRDG